MAIHAWTEGQRIYVRTPYEYKDIMKSITAEGGTRKTKHGITHVPTARLLRL